MPKYTIMEAKEVTQFVYYKYTVEATDQDDAMIKAQTNVAHATQINGESEKRFGESGWAVAEDDSSEAIDRAICEAEENFTENFSYQK